jgi:hypothetical protein
MSDDRWTALDRPEPLVSGVYGRWSGKANRGEKYDPERLRLFACACLRRLWPLLGEGHRGAVELLEQHARSPRLGDLAAARRAYRDEARELTQEWVRLWAARWSATNVQRALSKWNFPWYTMTGLAGEGCADLPARLEITARCRAASAVWKAAEAKVTTAALACTKAAEAVGFQEMCERARQGQQPTLPGGYAYAPTYSTRESAAQADLFRDVFVNPSRGPVRAERSWLAWNGRTVVKMARAIDKSQEWDRLPVLADALEDAGCTDAEVLGHLRSEGPHVRGCWAIDLLLGRVL